MQLLAAKAAIEAVHTSAGIDQLLLASVERMALGADFNVDLGLGGAGLDHVAARAGDGAVNVIGMDTLFHLRFTSFLVLTNWGHIPMYAPITTFNFGYPVERPWKRLLNYYSTNLKKIKGFFAARRRPSPLFSGFDTGAL